MFLVKLSEDTSKLIQDELKDASASTELPLATLLNYLNQPTLVQSLRILILDDIVDALQLSFNKTIYKKKAAHKKISWKQKVMLALGLTAGVLNTICDSFGSLSVLLSMLIDVTTAGFAMLWASLGFALLCAGFFVLYYLSMLSKSTQTPWLKVTETLSNYIEERQILHALLIFMDKGCFYTHYEKHGLTTDELLSLKALISQRGEFLKFKSAELSQQREGLVPTLGRASIVTCLSLWSLTGGFMFGFFAVGMIMVLVPSIVVPIWACAVFGAVTGLSAFFTFWNTLRNDVSVTVDRVIGVDKESTDEMQEPLDLDLEIFHKLDAKPPPQPNEAELYTPVFHKHAANDTPSQPANDRVEIDRADLLPSSNFL